MRARLGVLGALLLAASLPLGAAPEGNAELEEQVRRTEAAFAKTMADRDHAAFTSFLAEETIFLGGKSPHRGKAALAAAWKRFFEKPEAPFSWRPEKVVVLDSGTLAMTTGPVFDPAGKPSGSFKSVWRREPDGAWKIVLDDGCDCASPPSP
jgi:ketosteroid isomerase-like protein